MKFPLFPLWPTAVAVAAAAVVTPLIVHFVESGLSVYFLVPVPVFSWCGIPIASLFCLVPT